MTETETLCVAASMVANDNVDAQLNHFKRRDEPIRKQNSTQVVRTSLVRADIRHCAECLKRLEVSHNYVSLNHALRSGSHSNGKNHDQRRRDHTESGSDSIDDNFLLVGKVVRSQHDDRTHYRNAEQQHRETRELLLQWCTNIDSEEAADRISGCETPGLSVSMRTGFSLVVALDLSYLLSR